MLPDGTPALKVDSNGDVIAPKDQFGNDLPIVDKDGNVIGKLEHEPIAAPKDLTGKNFQDLLAKATADTFKKVISNPDAFDNVGLPKNEQGNPVMKTDENGQPLVPKDSNNKP